LVKFIQILKHSSIKLLIRLTILWLILLPVHVFSQTDTVQSFQASPIDTLATNDSIKVPKKSSDIKSPIHYNAVDSIFFDVRKQEVQLYGKAHLDYDNIKLDAPFITVNLKNATLEAEAKLDSNGKVKEWPILEQGDDKFQAKTIMFNYKTSRGYIEDVYTQEGEGFLHTDQAYLDENKTMYVENASYTTCNLAQPHYHFKMSKAKVIPNDKIVARSINLYIDSIPTPIFIPFGLFPTQTKRSSGLLLPNNFGPSQYGSFFVSGFGYYWAISDSLTARLTGEIHANGSWGLKPAVEYRVRYKYSGFLNMEYTKFINNSDEFLRSNNRNVAINWQHTPVSRGGRRLTADVRYQNAAYNSFNALQNQRRSLPQVNSSVTYFIPFKRIPFSLNISAKHNQSNASGENIFNLPNFTLNYSGERNPYKLLPYTGTKPSKFRKEILEQINISYTTSGANKMSTNAFARQLNPYNFVFQNPIDTTNLVINGQNIGELLSRNKFYMSHQASIGDNIKLKAFTLTPSLNYNEYWYFNRSDFTIDKLAKTASYNQQAGFYRFGRVSANANLSTTIYNFYTLGRVRVVKNDSLKTKLDKQIKFRHQINPNLSFSTSPSYLNDPRVYQSFGSGQDSVTYNRYFQYAETPSNQTKTRSIGISVNNNIEMKLPEKKKNQLNPNYELKPIAPINLLRLSFNGSYNLAADSLKMSNLSVSAQNTSIFGGLLNFTANATFDPYQYDSVATSYKKVDKYWAGNDKGLARLQNFTFISGLRLSPTAFKRKSKSGTTPVIKKKEDTYFYSLGYLDFSLPWSLNVSHNFNWNHATPNSDTTTTHSIGFSGTLKLSEKWNSDFSFNYNIKEKQFSYPLINLNRDLHCWYMRFSWAPFGPNTNYQFFIGVKASMLSDLKYKKQSSPYDRSF
jgi:LptD protein